MGVIEDLARIIGAMGRSGRAMVAFDGPDASGKTMMAHRLADLLTRPTLRASIDGFHNPRQVRIARGMDSPYGYYHDSFNHVALEENLLGPFSRGDPTVRTRVFDLHAAAPVDSDPVLVPPHCTLLLDGVFLLRPELRHWWNLSIYLHVPEEVTIARARVRDAEIFGSPEAVEARYRARYLPGQALYREEAKPQHAAHIVIDNTDHHHPVVLKWDAAV
jgi:uridine kinase